MSGEQLELPFDPPLEESLAPWVASNKPSYEAVESVDTAKQLTAERGSVYGHPLDNFQDIHVAKAVIAKCEDVAVQHALEMIWVKVCRLVETPDHQDSIADIKGYAETINMIHSERKRRENDK